MVKSKEFRGMLGQEWVGFSTHFYPCLSISIYSFWPYTFVSAVRISVRDESERLENFILRSSSGSRAELVRLEASVG